MKGAGAVAVDGPVGAGLGVVAGEDGGRSENFAGAARKGQREPKECG